MPKITKTDTLFSDIKILIEQTRAKTAITVNSALTLMYWQVGQKINDVILENKRAEYGEEIVYALSRQLTQEFGKSYSKQNLFHMIRFAKVFDDFEKVTSLSRQLSWTHFRMLIYMDDSLRREFYLGMCMTEHWSTRVLTGRIDSMLYERTALSRQPKGLIKKELEMLKNGEIASSIVLKDPYVLDFLELNDHYLEKDFEDAILRDIEQFIMELGIGFSFIARQKVIQIDGEDFKIDLLFYNRKLKQLVVIELKIGKFKASYKGQMELYLKWLEKHEKEEGEKSPIGIILCADKKNEQIELLELDKSNIHVAEYLTVLPPKELLAAKLHEALVYAREKHSIGQQEI